MKKKILIATPYYFPAAGGLEQYARQLAIGLKKRGWGVVVVTSGKPKQVTKELIDDLVVYRLPTQVTISNTPFSFKWKKQIRQILDLEKPSIINAHSPVPGMADAIYSARQKTPYVLTYHALSMQKHGKMFTNTLILFYEQIWLRRLVKGSNELISASPQTAKYLNKWRAGSTIITSATDPQLFKPANRLPEEPRFAFLGGLKKAEAHKGLKDAIMAVKIVSQTLPEVHLTVVGGGDKLNWFKNKVARLDLERNVTFTGQLTPESVAKIFKQQRGMIITYRQDNLPTVVFEALATGLPIIATNVGSIPSIVEANNGLIVEAGDVKGFAEAIEAIAINDKLANKQSAANRLKGLETTWEKQTSKLETIVQNLIRESK